MPHADVNGNRIYFEDTGGDGPPVILGHGFLMDADMFVHQVAALRDDYRVITWDERGFGRTEYDGEPFTYWDSAADCLGLLDTQAGAEDPEVVPGYEGLRDTWMAAGPVDELVEAVAGLIISDPDVNPVWIAKWKQQPNDYIAQPFATLMSRDDVTDRLGEITCPALVVHGTEDVSISMDKAEALSAGLVGSNGVVKVGGAHAANLTNPGPVNDAILSFLVDLPD